MRKEIRGEVQAAMTEIGEEWKIIVEQINKSDNETSSIVKN